MGLITNNLTDIGPALLDMGSRVEVPTWQALDVRDKPQGATIELENTLLHAWKIPSTVEELQAACEPNLPWAENQFLERVGGKPLNPGETFKEWPWYKGNVEQHRKLTCPNCKTEFTGHQSKTMPCPVCAENLPPFGSIDPKFSHTYMERYWPKRANGGKSGSGGTRVHQGIRYEYGDLYDVVKLLNVQPTTRQAYLPVFFPEDTGAVHGGRVPCSLGYLFMLRNGRLNITYYIRSCDFLRHFRDDVYMTARLCQWVLDQLVPRRPEDDQPMSADEYDDRSLMDTPRDHATKEWAGVEPGHLTMHIGSLHVFEGDLPKLRREYGG